MAKIAVANTSNINLNIFIVYRAKLLIKPPFNKYHTKVCLQVFKIYINFQTTADCVKFFYQNPKRSTRFSRTFIKISYR